MWCRVLIEAFRKNKPEWLDSKQVQTRVPDELRGICIHLHLIVVQENKFKQL